MVRQSDVTPTSHLQGIRLFFSIDLVGSTDFKGKAQREAFLANKADTGWPQIFGSFYRDVSQAFVSKAHDLEKKFAEEGVPCKIVLWKPIGDELTFYSSQIPSEHHVAIFCHAFSRIIERFDREYREEHKLGVKGTVWSAGFPHRNKMVRFDPRLPPYFGVIHISEDEFGDSLLIGPTCTFDFLGPDIDLGFRLCHESVPGRVLVSLEVAVLLALSPYSPSYLVRLFHVGWSRLKGVHGGTPYPIIWIDTHELHVKPTPRSAFEEADNPYSQKYLSGSGFLHKEQMLDLNRLHYRDTSEYRLERPYLNPARDSVPSSHDQKWREHMNSRKSKEGN